jgi:glycosyltransferase involved in cell wall biosynthesis
MTIGLDISSLQTGHRMRGIGYTLINIMDNLPPEVRSEHRFVFYAYPDKDDPLELLNLEGVDYEVRPLHDPKRITKTLPGTLNIIIKLLNKLVSLRDSYRGDPRITDLAGVEAFLQTDQSVSLPRGRHIKKAFIAYDLIPYLLEWDYLWDYQTARSHGLSRLVSRRVAARRKVYIHHLRVNARRATKVFAISETTRKNFLQHTGVNRKKIMTVPLGTKPAAAPSDEECPIRHRYMTTSWGYVKRAEKFDDQTPYLLFVGGADKRRKLDDLVITYNHLRARGQKFQLVMAGDIMQGPRNIPTDRVQKLLLDSSYLGDIVFLGFVSDAERDWLYRHAAAFVFPSRYEGFGLPVLEAMGYGTPVIAYPNAATKEVAADIPSYATDAESMLEAVEHLQGLGKTAHENLKRKSIKQAKKFSWEATVNTIFSQLTS